MKSIVNTMKWHTHLCPVDNMLVHQFSACWSTSELKLPAKKSRKKCQHIDPDHPVNRWY
jgi:hypothetical protein